MTDAPTTLIDPAIKSPRYMQVYVSLREWILQGNYAPGDRLQSESELCDLFGVSRITTRKAIDMLAEENLIHRIQGKGTFVADVLPAQSINAHISERIERFRRLAKNSRLKNIEIKQEVADENVCRDLQRPSGTTVQRISYVRLLDGEPVGFSVTTIPDDVGVTIKRSDLKSGTPMSILEDRGVPIGGANHLIGATLADSRLASLLRTSVGSPILRVKVVVFDTKGRPIDLLVAHYRADRYEHHVALSREQYSKS